MSGRTFEQFTIGETFTTQHRVITAEHVGQFREITGDRNPLHEEGGDPTHPLGTGVVHGVLVASVANGLISTLGLTRDTLVALLEQQLSYRNPVHFGASVQAEMEVVSKRATRNPEKGIITYRFTVRDGDGTVVLEGTNTIMVFTEQHRKEK